MNWLTLTSTHPKNLFLHVKNYRVSMIEDNNRTAERVLVRFQY